jgi:RIO kinase 2
LNLTTLSQYSSLGQGLIEHHLERLVKFGLISKSNLGYTLLVTGLDIYVLKILSNKNIITALGPQVGIGKEAEVYLARDSSDQDRVLKMFRLGRSSFKQIKRKRDVNTAINSWLLLNIDTAKKEYDILTNLKDSSNSFPNPLYRSFHCIVMDAIYGNRLSDTENLNDPELVFDRIIDNITIAYHKGYINGDLNEYNILVDDDNVSILDWPQAVKIDAINADAVLTRDIQNITKYFSKKFGIEKDSHKIIGNVKRNASKT